MRVSSSPSITQREAEPISSPVYAHAPHRSSHSHRGHHHHLSEEDRELARVLQREEESRVSEAAIRWGLTQQFARAANRPVEEVDLSALTLAEAQQAIEIQLTIRQQHKKRSVMSALRARFSGRKRGGSAAASSPSASSASAQHLSPVNRAEQRSSSPSPSPPSPYRDVDSMSYEELLALGEAIGDVKGKGLTEADIDRLPTAVFRRQWKQGEAEQEAEREAEAAQLPVAASPPLGAVSAADAAAGKDRQQKKRWFFSRQAKANGREEAAVVATTAALKGKEEQKAQSGQQQQQQQQRPPASAAPVSPAEAASAEARWRDTCSICLEPFRDGDLLRFLPCLHRMHCEELDQWLLVNASCPVCKEKPTLH